MASNSLSAVMGVLQWSVLFDTFECGETSLRLISVNMHPNGRSPFKLNVVLYLLSLGWIVCLFTKQTPE